MPRRTISSAAGKTRSQDAPVAYPLSGGAHPAEGADMGFIPSQMPITGRALVSVGTPFSFSA